MIDESRVRHLFVTEAICQDADIPIEYLNRKLCEMMGRSIAEKLFEFNKIKVVHENGMRIVSASIDVIVPK